MEEKMNEHKSVSHKSAKNSNTEQLISPSSNKNKETPKQVQDNNITGQNNKKLSPTPTPKTNYKKNENDLLNFIDKIKKEDVVVKSDSVLKSELEVFNFKANKNSNFASSINRTNTANVDLASRLLSEQKKIRQEKLSNLPNTEKLTPNRIAEVSKKLGIDKSSLQTKQNLDNLLQNEDELKKLREKFVMKN
jgi:hypothetical protein